MIAMDMAGTANVLHQESPLRLEGLRNVAKHGIGLCLIMNGVESSNQVEGSNVRQLSHVDDCEGNVA